MKAAAHRLAALEARRARQRAAICDKDDFFYHFRRPDMFEWNLHIALTSQKDRLDPLHRPHQKFDFEYDLDACICRQPHPPLAPEDWPHDDEERRSFNEYLASIRRP